MKTIAAAFSAWFVRSRRLAYAREVVPYLEAAYRAGFREAQKRHLAARLEEVRRPQE